MKATDLMIGDWVDMYHELQDESGFYKPLQVTGVHNHDGVCFGHDVIECPWIDPEEFEAVEPIPLTPEILEKNGFEYEKNIGYVYEDYNSSTKVIVDFWDNTIQIVHNYDIKFNYTYYDNIMVHKFQHILKDLKIEKDIIL